DPVTIASLTLVADLPAERRVKTTPGTGRVTAAGYQTLLRLFQNFDKTPAFGRRRRTRLHQRNAVADAGGAVLVVRLDLRGGTDDLAVQRVPHAVFELDHDGFLHLVTHHVTDAHLALATRLRGARSLLGALLFRPGIRGSGLLGGRFWGRLGGLGGGLRFCHHDSLPSGPEAKPSSRSRSTV